MLFVRENVTFLYAAEQYIQHYSFHPLVLCPEPVPVSSITRCQSSSREVFATEPLTCHSGHWCPINENSAGDFPSLLRDYGERQEPSLSHLGCSSLRKTAIVTTSLPQAALLRSMISDRLICLFQTIAGILIPAVSDGKFRKLFHALINDHNV